MNSETKQCQNCQQNFTIELEDFEFYAKIKVPAPTFCPDCRTQRRILFRNERSLYKRKCDAPGHTEEMLTIYSSDKNLKVYDQKYWWSDEWDPLSYSRDYDFSKSFFQQFKEFRDNFPLITISNSEAINSEFCNVAGKSKDCYLVSAAQKNESVLYSNRVYINRDSMDLYIAFKNELCYENIGCKDCYKVLFSFNSLNCSDSYFLYDCRNCSNCFGCVNLRNKQYFIFNKQYSKEKYFEKIKEFDLGSYNNILKIKEEFKLIRLINPSRFANIAKSQNSTGDNIGNSNNCHKCFDIIAETENGRYLVWAGAMKDSHSSGPGVGDSAELIYDAFDTGDQGARLFFTSVVYGSHDIQYSFNCMGSSNLFACVGLRNKQYCILNKQYTKEEYEQLVPKIIEHMNNMPYIDKKGRVYKYGEFFPSELSPFCYNETIAQEYFPLTKEQAEQQGYSWKDPETRNFQFSILNFQLPDNIKDVKDDILTQVIECQHNNTNCNEQCTTAFKIIPQELDFYKKMNLPLPRLCPNCRHYQRIKQRNPLKLWKRTCQCQGQTGNNSNNPNIYQNTITHTHGTEPCPNEFETTYSPDRKEIVYCEQCYQQEVA